MIARKTALILGLALASPSLVMAEITRAEDAPAKANSLQLMGAAPLSLACWQEGRKIIDEKGLSALNSGTFVQSPTLSFRPLDDPSGRLLLLSIAGTICMMKSEIAPSK